MPRPTPHAATPRPRPGRRRAREEMSLHGDFGRTARRVGRGSPSLFVMYSTCTHTPPLNHSAERSNRAYSSSPAKSRMRTTRPTPSTVEVWISHKRTRAQCHHAQPRRRARGRTCEHRHPPTHKQPRHEGATPCARHIRPLSGAAAGSRRAGSEPLQTRSSVRWPGASP